MTYTVYLPTDDAGTALAFHKDADTLEEAIAAAGDTPGAQVERAIPGGSSIVHRVPLNPGAERAEAVAAAEALLPEGFRVVEEAPIEPASEAVVDVVAEAPTPAEAPARAPRKRARKDDGTFIADDPATPDVNEAFEDGLAGDENAEQQADLKP
jgi:transcription termination factor Rho